MSTARGLGQSTSMTKITAETAVTIPEHVLTRNLDGELVMLNLENERYYGLDDIGTHCWEALETSANLAQAGARLAAVFDASEDTILADLIELVSDLTNEGIVSVDPQ